MIEDVKKMISFYVTKLIKNLCSWTLKIESQTFSCNKSNNK